MTKVSRLLVRGLLSAASMSMTITCLPKDTRPPPASIEVTASSDDAVKEGFATLDGWHLDFTRFVVSIGRTGFDEGGPCTPYSDARYSRVLDLRQPGTQKLSLLYALGQCNFAFGVVHPSSDSIVGPGVAAADALFMQTIGSDKYTTSLNPNGLNGANALIDGTAKKADVTKTFAWVFRLDIKYSNCLTDTDAGIEQGLSLRGQDSLQLDIQAQGEGLFRDNVDPSIAALRFDPIAMADTGPGNNDGTVSLDELGLVPLSSIQLGSLGGSDAGLPPAPSDLDGGAPPYTAGAAEAAIVSTLEDFVYLSLFPTIFRYRDTGTCTVAPMKSGRGG